MKLIQQLIRFLLIGGFATVVHFSILVSVVQARVAGVITGSSAGFVVSAAVNYLLNRRYTFRAKVPHSRALPRFLAVAIAGLGLNAVVLWVAADLTGLHYLVSQTAATTLTVAWNFSLSRLWTFAT